MITARTWFHAIAALALVAALFVTVSPVRATGSTITVNTTDNTLDDHLCSFEEAIQASNENSGWTHTDDCPAGTVGSATDFDTINFAIGTPGSAQTITLAARVDITDRVYIDGTSQGTSAGGPLITITGNPTYLLYVLDAPAGNTIKSLRLISTSTDLSYKCNVRFIRTDSNIISGNYFNTDGTQSFGNAWGPCFLNSSSNMIGGDTSADRNLFAGAGGVHIQGGSSSGVWNNYFGLQADGTTALTGLPMAGTAVYIAPDTADTTLNTIRDNVITGYATGILLDGRQGAAGTHVDQTSIRGNKIGTNADGSAARPNTTGIGLWAATNTTIGGTTAWERNVVSGNGFADIVINNAPGTMSTRIWGNYIGTNAAGTADIDGSTSGYGLDLAGGSGTEIGGTVASKGNVISGHGTAIVTVSSATGTVILGNRIGTDKDGLTALPNNGGLDLSSDENLGDALTPGNNLISGNNGTAISVESGATPTIYDNLIGMKADLSDDLPNNIGIRLYSGASASIVRNWLSDAVTYPFFIHSGATLAVPASENCITNDSTTWGVYYLGTSDLSFPHNWWREPAGPTSSTMPGGPLFVSDHVLFDPWSLKQTVACGPGVKLDATTLGFGEQRIGTTSAQQTITLTNDGRKTLTFSEIAASTSYGVGSGTCYGAGGTVLPGASCTILVTFSPTAAGAMPGTLSISSDAASSPELVTLTGNGTQPMVLLDHTSLNFAPQLIGTSSSAQSVNLTNTGNVLLHIDSIAVVAPYSLGAGTCPITNGDVAVGASCTILVKFSPTAIGYAPAPSVIISSNAPSSPTLITLTGSGTAGAQLLKNPSFETDANQDSRPDLFTYAAFNPATDKRDCTVRKAGTCSLKLAGNGQSKTIAQTITRAGAVGDDFSFSLWSRATGVPRSAVYRVQLLYYRNSVLLGTSTANFNKGTHAFQKASGTFTAPWSYTKVVLKISFKAAAGGAWFDVGALNWAR